MSEEIVSPLGSILPFEQSMPLLVGVQPVSLETIQSVDQLCMKFSDPAIQAGLWLYIDQLERAHDIVQGLDSEEGAYWHAIIHRREGDFWNSKYWFRRCGTISLTVPEYDPVAFVDRVQAHAGRNEEALVALQRREWSALLDYCWSPDGRR